jgi:hypothetical protein
MERIANSKSLVNFSMVGLFSKKVFKTSDPPYFTLKSEGFAGVLSVTPLYGSYSVRIDEK